MRAKKTRPQAGGPRVAGAFAGSGMRVNHSGSRARSKAMAKAAARRDSGIAACAQHAEECAPGWTDRACLALERFAAQQSRPWTCEQFRAWAHARGLDCPPEKRAFGAVIQVGLRAGWFARVGYAPTASSNCGAKPLYQAPSA